MSWRDAPLVGEQKPAGKWSEAPAVDLDAQAKAAAKGNPPSSYTVSEDLNYFDSPANKARAFGRNLVPGFDYAAAGVAKVADPDKPYESHVEEQRVRNKVAEQANPGSAAVGAIGQGAALSMVPGGWKARLAAETAAGGLNALGRSEAEGVGGKLLDAAKGAGTTLALGGAGEAVGGAVKAAGRAVKRGIESEDTVGALRAVGATGGDFSAVRNTPAGKAQIAGIADDLHAEGVVRPGASTADMEESLGFQKRYWGGRLGNIYKQLDGLGAQGDVQNIQFGLVRARDKFARMAGTDNTGRAGRVQAELDKIVSLAAGRQQIPLSELQGWRAQIDDLIYEYAPSTDPAANLTKSTLMEVREVLDTDLQRAAQSAIQQNGAAGLGLELDEARRKYHHVATASEWAQDAAAKAEASKVVPYLAGGTGMAAIGLGVTGHPEEAAGFGASTIAALLFRKSLEPRLASTLSAGAHRYLNPGPVGRAVQAAGSAIPPAAGAAMRGGAAYAGGQQATETPMSPEEMEEFIRYLNGSQR